MNKQLYQSILIIIGFVMFTALVWLRFIRERLPKDIPFNLSLLSFCILLVTCAIFLYIIVSLFRESKSANPIFKQLIDYIYMPLKTLDHMIKNISYTNNTYKYGINFLAYILGPIIIDSKIYYYIFVIIPRLVLLAALYIDIFCFDKLYYIYKVLLVGILLLIGKYIIYSFKYAKENFIETFEHYVSITMNYNIAISYVILDTDDEDDEDDDIPPTIEVPLPIFVEIQTDIYTKRGHYSDYMPFMRSPVASADYYKEHNIIVSRIFTYEEVKDRVNNILKISLILTHYDIVNNYDKSIKDLKKLIYINYFLCWSYILITSLHNLPHDAFSWLWVIQNIEEPFNNVILNHDNHAN